MKLLTTLLAATLVSTSLAGEWTPLFNGEDFSGWTFDTLDKAAPETIWSVKEGKIVVAGKGKPNGVLRTEQRWSNNKAIE